MVRKTIEAELNKLIDNLMHPQFEKYPVLIVVDGVFHTLVEQDLSVSLRKFVRYNGPKLLKYLERKLK